MGIAIIYIRLVQYNGFVRQNKFCWCLRGPIKFICLCHNKKWGSGVSPSAIFGKAICDSVHFGNARHYILYHLKINISWAAITHTHQPILFYSYHCPTCHNIISGECWMKATFWTNSEIPTFISVVTIAMQLPSMSTANLLWQLDFVYVFHYWKSTCANISAARRRTKFKWKISCNFGNRSSV